MAIKRGELYSNIKDKLRSFDIILFKGVDLISKVIESLQKRGNKIPEAGDFSHIGICLRYDILKYIYPNHPKITENCCMIWESTMSGKLSLDVYDINGRTVFGTQLRDFDELIIKYDDSDSSAIAIGSLIDNPITHSNIEETGILFKTIFEKYNNKQYDANIVSLISVLFPIYRSCSRTLEYILNTEEWLFCSELVAIVFKELHIYPDNVDPKTVCPRDIAYNEADSEDITPKIINSITYITTPKHYKENISNIDYKINNHKMIEITK